MNIQKISALQINQRVNNSKAMTNVKPMLALPKEVKIDSVSFKGDDDDCGGLFKAVGIAWIASCVALGFSFL